MGKKGLQLEVPKLRERRCSFRCATVWVISRFSHVLLTDADHGANSRPGVNTRPLALWRRIGGASCGRPPLAYNGVQDAA